MITLLASAILLPIAIALTMELFVEALEIAVIIGVPALVLALVL